MPSRLTLIAILLGLSRLHAMDPPKLLDPALKLEALCTVPDIEAPTTVVGAPDGSFYVGCDPRDTRLNTERPECYVVRFSSMGAEKKRTVFADKIYSPAGSAWHDGWLYVAHDPFLTRFRDTDRDGIADMREDLITNLGHQPYPGLNDHCASGFTLGMDGFFYMSIGDRGTFQTRSVKDGSTISMQGGGIIRFRPDGTALEIFSTGTRNHLAVCLDAEDNAFTLDNTDDGNGWWTRLTHHIEGGYYGYPYDYQKAENFGVTQPSKETLEAAKRHFGNDQGPMTNDQSRERAPRSLVTGHWSFLPALADFGGGSPTGGLCYLSDGLPEPYRGKLLFSEWGKQNISVIEVARDGATFRFVKNTPLLQGGNGSDFRPMQLSVAADGSLLIADWQWGGWKGPKTVGTIWRLSWPEAQPAPRLKDERKATVEELLAALAHPDRDQRLRAQGVLAKTGIETTKKLGAKIVDLDAPLNARLHALNAFQALGRNLDLVTTHKEKEANQQNALIQETTNQWIQILLKASDDLFPSIGCASIRMFQKVPGFGSFGGGEGYTKNDSIIGEALLQKLNDWDASVRREAISACLHRPPWSEEEERISYILCERIRDTDRFVGFTALRVAPLLVRSLEVLLSDPDPLTRKMVWRQVSFSQPQAPGSNFTGDYVERIFLALANEQDKDLKIRAIAALGRIAYRHKEWDGHWWGTQPVKNLPEIPNVVWKGTPKALGALTAALADGDAAVRLVAAKAFTDFKVDKSAPAHVNFFESTCASLRERLKGETDPAIRRQLIESLGVQKDPQAMEVFRQIALDEKADADFRDTAIKAIVHFGGDDARKTIAQLPLDKLSPAARHTVIVAAGELRMLETAPMLMLFLVSGNVADQMAAINSLAQLGPKSGATDAFLTLLRPEIDVKVQTAAVEALGSFKDKRALPALLDFSKTKRARRETINAVAALMPDTQALSFLVDALREKGGGERRSALTALKKMRAEAWPMIEENLASGRIPPEFAQEIGMAFDSGVIAKWKVIGPFENVWEAVHPPEADLLRGLPLQRRAGQVEGPPSNPLAAGAASHVAESLALRYTNAEGKETGWNDVSASATEGRVDLGKIFKTSGMVCAYAFTEIESPEDADAKLLCGSDDQIAVWLNGKKLHDSGPGSRSLNADQDEVPIHFTKGRNALLVKIGNVGGGWEFAARIPGLDGGKFTPNQEPAPDAKQRAYALATKPDGTWQNPGNATRGEKLFHDPAAALGGLCATCHKVRGLGKEIGPDLSLVGSIYKRADLIVSILEPGKTIALGFEQSVIETNGGETFIGALRQETGEAFTLVGVDGQPHVINKADVKTHKPVAQSLMPTGLTLGLKPEDFADLVAFLETLK